MKARLWLTEISPQRFNNNLMREEERGIKEEERGIKEEEERKRKRGKKIEYQ
jgi:hypothetical protein